MYKYVFILLGICVIMFNTIELRSEEVDLSTAEKMGAITVKFIASNEKKSRFIIRNETDKPLTIKLPTSFAAIPVLAQINNGAGFNNGGIVRNDPQRLGGGLPQNNAFGVNPFATIVVPVNTVCLDFGLPTPNTRTKFRIVPIEEISYDPKVNNILMALANKRIPQQIAQIAVWNVHNQTPFNSIRNTGLFSQSDIAAAQSVVINL